MSVSNGKIFILQTHLTGICNAYGMVFVSYQRMVKL